MSIQHLCWPLSGLGKAVGALTGKQGDPPPPPASVEVLPEWATWAALRCRLEVNTADIMLRDLDLLLATATPALYELDEGYLVVLKAGKTLRVLAPDLSTQKVRSDVIAAAVRAPYEALRRPSCQALIAESGIRPAHRERALAALLNEQTGASRFQRCWTFCDNSNRVRMWRGVPQLIASHATQYLLWIASWAVLGTLSFTGRMDRGWLTAWALLLATLIPFRLLTLWTQGTFAIGLGALLKQRLLRGALRLEPEEVRAGGVGSFLGQALQAEAIETLATSGGITGLLAFVELIPAMFILGRLAIALIIWSGIAIFAAWRFYKGYQRWTTKRMELTNHLVEMMVGQRTRLAQQLREDRHTSEDASLAQYRSTSASLDQTGSWMVAGIPRGWLLLGVLCLAPSLTVGHALSSETAILLGGVLLGFSAFQRLVASFADVAAALTSWQVIRPLVEAAGRRELTGEFLPVRKQARAGLPLLEADRLTFRYQGHATAALQAVNLSVRCGEKVLLEGPSGGGKTTLASLLTGLRKPESGLLLVNGFDRHTLGESGWRKQVAAAPQFHENHLVTETLAFNLLMGRNWPPLNKDIEEAEKLCGELGLADLIGRMPSGLMQMVGEGGWQLSHGERSRIFLARALLQRADLVILDESFAALDPENLQIAMETTLRRAETLLVIAHP